MKKQSAAALSVLLLSAGLLCGASTVSAEIPTKPFDIPDGGLRFRFDGDAEEASGAVSGRLRGNPRFVEGRPRRAAVIPLRTFTFQACMFLQRMFFCAPGVHDPFFAEVTDLQICTPTHMERTRPHPARKRRYP